MPVRRDPSSLRFLRIRLSSMERLFGEGVCGFGKGC